MTALRIILLLLGVFGAVVRPVRLPAWTLPLGAVLVALASGAVSPDTAREAVEPLRAPVGFLLAAVPLAVLLDRLGFFAALAGFASRGRGIGGLWVLAAVVTTVLNLDASVVLLTPLYIRIAHQRRQDPLLLAFPPVLLACLASSALPVSNLTNLIVVARTGAGTWDFLRNLALPSLAATAVGWLAFRRFVVPHRSGRTEEPAGCRPARGAEPAGHPVRSSPAPGAGSASRRPLVVGGAVMAVVLVGFVGGEAIGVAPWVVALGADVVLLVPAAFERGWSPRSGVPWRAIPVGTGLVALCLAVLAAGAVSHLGVHRFVSGSSTLDLARTAAVSGAAANLFNNLPALLVALGTLGRHVTPSLWAVLIGVNMGPVLLITGSLASLLWLATLQRLEVSVRPRDFFSVGWRVGLPGALAGLGVSLGLHALGVS